MTALLNGGRPQTRETKQSAQMFERSLLSLGEANWKNFHRCENAWKCGEPGNRA